MSKATETDKAPEAEAEETSKAVVPAKAKGPEVPPLTDEEIAKLRAMLVASHA